jgi:hypothetical protein
VYNDLSYKWDKSKSRLPEHDIPFLCIGDVVKLTVKEYFNNDYTKRISRILGFERGLYQESVPINFEECEDHVEQNNIVIIPPPVVGEKQKK